MKLRLCLIAALVAAGCNDAQERFEDVAKLRAIGVAGTPVVGAPTPPGQAEPTLATLTFYAALPPGGIVTADTYLDPASKYAAPVPLVIDPTSAAYEDHSGFRIFSIRATLAMPPAAALPLPPTPGFARLRYSMVLRSGNEEEKIVGNYLVYPPADANATKFNDGVMVSIISPGDGDHLSGTRNLVGAVTTTSGENVRVGWYVTKGKVKNHRARSTEWQTDGGGDQTILMTARGLSSGAFSLKAIDVHVD